MTRWRAAVLFVPLALACHTSTGTPPPTGPTGDDATTTMCPCVVSGEAGASYVIPCKTIGCADGIEYLCEDGIPSAQGACVPTTTDACRPYCPGDQCRIDDGCGGMCNCPSGQSCVFGHCSTNGCLLGVGEYCGLDPEAGANDCCASGLRCPTGEAGSSQCCVLSNGAPCSVDTDCCSYPAVHCLSVANDAGLSTSECR